MGLVNNGKIVAGAAPSAVSIYPYEIDYAGKFDGTAYLYRLAGDNPFNNAF